jgi:predicted nucleic acid-binding protein
VRVFIDTNLWAYRFDHREPEKRNRVKGWLRSIAENHEIVISTQVMIELRAFLTRKLTPPLSFADTQAALQALTGFEVVPAETSLILDAHVLAETHQLAWFDALIAEAAIRSGCRVLCSEDFGHGQRLGGVIVHNPFQTPHELP